MSENIYTPKNLFFYKLLPIIVLNIIYFIWILYLMNSNLSDKIYVVNVFWTIIILLVNILCYYFIKIKNLQGPKLILYLIYFESIGIFVFPFLI